MPDIYVLCGVSASGKSTVASKLAPTLNCVFLEGDNYHPTENIKKMKSGIALTDNDRKSWILAISKEVNRLEQNIYVLSCSALTLFVQEELKRLCEPTIHWIILDISKETAYGRAHSRNHFMPADLIDSQFEAWSPPKNGLHIDASLPMAEILQIIHRHISNG